MDKPNCYNCIYRRNVPGDRHSSCGHPAFREYIDDPAAFLLVLLGKRAGNIQLKSGECLVTGNPHGIARGWFNHPFNFDPVWLESCTGYKEKEKTDGNKG